MHPRFSFLTVAAILLLTELAFGQTAKVLKVKGRNAVVAFPEGHEPEVGDTISLKKGGERTGTGSRDYTLGLSGSLAMISDSRTSKNTTTLAVDGRFGWNMAQYEAGPIGEFRYSTADDRSSRTLGLGGFFDFNFIPNVAGEELVYGAGVEGTYGQSTVTTASVENSSTEMAFFGGLFAKWFGLGNFGVRGDAGYEYVRANTQSGTTVTSSGFLVKAGLQVYF